MQPTVEDAASLIVTRITENLRQVEMRVARLRRTNVRITGLSLLFSTAATLLAGLTAAAGPLAGEGPPAWRMTCGIIAVVTAATALVTGVQQRFQIPEQLARALAVAGRLRGLELSLRLSRVGPEQAGHEYEQLIATYPEELV
jgi:hypothetical protein